MIEKQFSEQNLNTNSQENSGDDMDVEQTICTKTVRHKSDKHKSLTQSKEITCSRAQRNWAANNELMRCLDWEGRWSIFCWRLRNWNRDGPYTAIDYIILQGIF